MANGQAAQQPRITRESLGEFLASEFTGKTSVIDADQQHSPPVGVRMQVTLRAGKSNFARLTSAQMEANEQGRSIPVRSEDRTSRYKRDAYGNPEMLARSELPTLEAIPARKYAEKLAPNVPMTFATPAQVNAVNVAWGGQSRSEAAIVIGNRKEKGFAIDVKPPDTGMRTVMREVKDEAGNKVRDSRGLVQREAIEQQGKPREREPKRLYHIDDLRMDTRPERVWTAQNHDEKGVQCRNVSGAVVRDDKGQALSNRDENGKAIEARIGDKCRDETGKVIDRAVELVGRRSDLTVPLQIGITTQALKAMSHKLEKDGPAIQINRDGRGAQASFSVVTKDGVDVPTVSLPRKFKSPDHELTELARAVSHVQQWKDPSSPNHDSAREAAKLPEKARANSPAYAACELTAQHAALATVTRAGGTFKAQPIAYNDKFRKAWAEQVQSPDGLQAFGDATDQASRVCAGKQPTRELAREHRQEQKRESLANQLVKTQEERGGRGDDSRGADMSGMMDTSPAPVRGGNRAATAAAAPAPPARGRTEETPGTPARP